jgi:thiol-disulfide isomerase/thioredoxin
MQRLRGQVVLVDFWAYMCGNCLNTLPHVKQWHERYARDGLVVVGVHTPELPAERDPKNVEHAIERYGISYPVALDPDYATWKAYSNRYWPALYLIDRQGRVVYRHFGEGAYDQTEARIRALLADAG